MDEEIFPVLCPKKTYTKTFKKVTESNNVEKIELMKNAYDPGVPLTTKVAVEYLLNGKLKTSVCRYCLKVTVGLSELDQILHIAGTGAMYKVSIREMIACFYPFKARQEANYPEKICQRCIDRALNAYLFTQQCEQAERALQNCFDDMNEKIIKLDPVDRPKKRGRQKLKPNFNVLYAEHVNVMDYAEPIRNIINSDTESLSKEPDWNEFECKRCWQVLPDLESLLNHEQQHPKYMWYHCRLCGKSFVKINQLKKHFTQVHVRGNGGKDEVDKTFKCKECGNVTENHVKHLQHIEKHKFKSIMQCLVEKKTNQMCLVCLKKSTDLVELDKMICIHGSCPELVGDKSLYTVLASTLPDQKSYKYQELHIPRKADIITITKRKRTYKEILNVPLITRIQFKLSLPKIITSNKFKTDDFYHYVFCEPQEGADNIISIINHDIAPQDTKCRRIFEITDEETMDRNLYHNILTNQGMSVIECSNNGDQMLNNVKELVSVAGNYNPVSEMDMEETGPIDSFKSVANNDVNQMELLENANPCSKNVTGHIESEDLIVNDYPIAKVLPNDKQMIGFTGNSDVKENICNVKEAMDVVSLCVPENNMLFNEARKTDNQEDTILIDEKYPSDSIKPNNIENEFIKSCFKVSKVSMFYFSNPAALEIDSNTDNHNIKLDADMVSFHFTNPKLVDKSSFQDMNDKKPIKEMDIPKHEIGPIKVKTDLSWIFTKTPDKYSSVKNNKLTDNDTNVIAETKTKEGDCKFCWLFKNVNKCEYCKKPNDKGLKITDDDKQNTDLDNIIKSDTEKQANNASFIDENVEIQPKPVTIEKYVKEPEIEKVWQCKLCLTNNNKDRSTCHCCESKKYIDNSNCKVTFGNNKTFFNTLGKENKEESNMDKEIDKSNKDAIPFVAMDEATMMDAKNGTIEENIEIQMDNVKDTNSTYSMDIETDSVTYTLDTKAITNEEMDVEEESFILIANTAQKFEPTHTWAANIVPYFGSPNIPTECLTQVGTNIQFNIGSNLIQNEKPARKIQRAVRKCQKLFISSPKV